MGGVCLYVDYYFLNDNAVDELKFQRLTHAAGIGE